MVSCKHDGRTLAEFLHALDDEQHPLFARNLRDMVCVGVGERETLLGRLVLKHRIGTNPRACRAPALLPWLVGRL